MSRHKKGPLRPLTDDEVATLAQLSRSQAAPAVQVARANMLLAVAGGDDYQTGRPRRRPPLRRRRLAPGQPLQRRGPGRHLAPPRGRPSTRL